MKGWAIAGMMLAVTSATAQTVMDGSERAVSAGEMSALREAMAARLFDPYGAQLRKLNTVKSGRVCGQINAKNKAGGLTGFKPFGFDVSRQILYIEPAEQSEPKPKEELEAMLADIQGVIRVCYE